MMQTPQRLTGWFTGPCLIAAVALSACTASIAGPDDATGSGASAATGSGSGSGSGVGSGASTGTGSGTGGPGAGGNGNTDGSGGTAPRVPGTDPGRVTAHRLNRTEYNNTVTDLLGTSSKPADVFPVDDRGDGFDNLADVLSLSPLHLSLYSEAAASLVDETFANQTLRSRLVSCNLQNEGASCARKTLEAFAPRAWRRPVSSAEIDRVAALVTVATGKGDSVEQGLKLALRSVLLSPNFLFRIELDPDPKSLTPHPLNGYELASRLSYFLWSTTPDEELTRTAADGTLVKPETIKAQVKRLLASPRAGAFVSNFAGQWLETRRAEELEPDPKTFPAFDPTLRDAMVGESNAFFKDLLAGTVTGKQLLSSDYIYANDRLAKHYGLPAPGSTTMQRVSVTGNAQRGGILGQASFLAVTSHATRTSPVLRGKWVLNQLLCTDIPPPPPDADVVSFDKAETGGTLRQRLEAHRASATCASCHSLMDPIGFGLENYDAIGAYRTTDAGAPVDASGELPGKLAFSGMRELANLVSKDARYGRCFVGKVYTYALGRSIVKTVPNHMDLDVIDELSKDYDASGMRFPELVEELVTSATFLNRRGEPESP